MKRIDIIIKGRKLTEKLFGLKRKQINRAIEAARDYAERQHEDGQWHTRPCSPKWPMIRPTISASSPK